MTDIRILSMRLINFKGIRDLTVLFNGQDTDISGDNGLGKSTIFDAFTWVMFGKDRLDRKQFGIKTVDKDSNIIHRIPHEVELRLTVSGAPLKLSRRYEEKWVKPKGSPTEEFQGHEETRLYNDVPCSVAEWKEKIAALCSEDVFKMITNPLYFSSQKPEVQREFLIRMAGGVSDAEIAAGNPDFTKLLSDITGKTLSDYKKEIGAKKQRIKKEIKDIPGQIKERKRDAKNFVVEDWEALEAERDRLTEERNGIIAQISDASAALNAQNEERTKVQQEINTLRNQIRDREYQITQEVKKEYRKQMAERDQLRDEHETLTRRRQQWERDRTGEQSEADQCTKTRERYLKEYAGLLETSQQLTAQHNNPQVQFNDSDFRCPTCGHQYDIDRIEEIQSNAVNEERAKISRQLNDNANAIEDNKRKGKLNNEKKTRHLATVDTLTQKITDATKRLTEIEGNPLYISAPVEPDATPAIEADDTIKQLNTKITELETSLNKEPERKDTSTLEQEEEKKSEEIMAIAVRLSKREDIEANNKRIEELEAELRTGNNEISELEVIEFVIQDFTKARINAVENKINTLFSFVRFKMFDTLIKGAEVETCEAMVDGVPFSDLNDAGKLNAGLDIINAICRYEQIYAPIFIDNSESINRPIPTTSQRIRLIVTHDPELVITPSDSTPSLFNQQNV